MVQSRGGTGFQFEAVNPLNVDGELCRQDLESDITPKAGVMGQINLAHPA
jgi:hypothetical protein